MRELSWLLCLEKEKTFKLAALTHQKMFAAGSCFQCLDRDAFYLISFHHPSFFLDITNITNSPSSNYPENTATSLGMPPPCSHLRFSWAFPLRSEPVSIENSQRERLSCKRREPIASIADATLSYLHGRVYGSCAKRASRCADDAWN